MKLPKKIHPDNLVDTIVEIRMRPQFPPELWAGMVSSRLLENGYVYRAIPQFSINLPPELKQTLDIQRTLVPGMGLFLKGDMRLLMQNNSLIFNCNLGKYVGWSTYSSEIEKGIKAVKDCGISKVFDRIALRYISEYKDMPILDKIKGVIDFKETGLDLCTQELKLSKTDGNAKVFVSLSNLIRRRNQHGEYIASLFDVNVFENFPETDSIDVLMGSLNKNHEIEKGTFFGLLKDDFIQSLNPEY